MVSARARRKAGDKWCVTEKRVGHGEAGQGKAGKGIGLGRAGQGSAGQGRAEQGRKRRRQCKRQCRTQRTSRKGKGHNGLRTGLTTSSEEGRAGRSTSSEEDRALRGARQSVGQSSVNKEDGRVDCVTQE